MRIAESRKRRDMAGGKVLLSHPFRDEAAERMVHGAFLRDVEFRSNRRSFDSLRSLRMTVHF